MSDGPTRHYAAQVDQNQQTPAGWYADPQMAGTQRYWDGAKWTDHVAPQQQAAVVAPADRDWMVPVGWVAVFVLPIAAFVLALFLPSKHSGHQAALIVGSLVVMFLWYLYLDGWL